MTQLSTRYVPGSAGRAMSTALRPYGPNRSLDLEAERVVRWIRREILELGQPVADAGDVELVRLLEELRDTR